MSTWGSGLRKELAPSTGGPALCHSARVRLLVAFVYVGISDADAATDPVTSIDI